MDLMAYIFISTDILLDIQLFGLLLRYLRMYLVKTRTVKQIDCRLSCQRSVDLITLSLDTRNSN